MTNRQGGLKIVDDNSYTADCKAPYTSRLHLLLESDRRSVCKSFGEPCDSSHLSKPKVYQAVQNTEEAATNSSQSLRALIIDSLVGNGHLS